MQCYKHPKEETGLSCGRCERPICTRCVVQGPAGVRCRDCASLKGSPLYKVAPGRLAAAIAVSVVLGLGGCFVYQIPFLLLFIAPAYGGFVGDMVLRASGQKRGTLIEAIAVGGVVLGVLVALAPHLLMLLNPELLANNMWLTTMTMNIGWKVIGGALAIGACYGRVHYL
jgi:hypothetical protein